MGSPPYILHAQKRAHGGCPEEIFKTVKRFGAILDRRNQCNGQS